MYPALLKKYISEIIRYSSMHSYIQYVYILPNSETYQLASIINIYLIVGIYKMKYLFAGWADETWWIQWNYR